MAGPMMVAMETHPHRCCYHYEAIASRASVSWLTTAAYKQIAFTCISPATALQVWSVKWKKPDKSPPEIDSNRFSRLSVANKPYLDRLLSSSVARREIGREERRRNRPRPNRHVSFMQICDCRIFLILPHYFFCIFSKVRISRFFRINWHFLQQF